MNKQQQAIDLIRQGSNIFLTGSGGVGKSWVIEQVMDNSTLLAAPTGIAALNVGGVTCHSLFGLPFGIPSKDDLHKTPYALNKLIRSGNVKRVIIDEIGMVRADMLDLINHRLQCAAGNELPFGGIQMVVVGDFFQLEPIVTYSEQRHLKQLYDTPFAFSAKCWDFPVIELTDVYRQSDREQIELLNNVRKGVALESTLNALVDISEPYVPSPQNTLLTARKDAAAKVNNYWFSKIATHPTTYSARTTGKFGKDTPVDSQLTLKAAARVIICANNRENNYVNGEAGIIHKCYGDTVEVLLDSGDLVSVVQHTWEKFKYTSSKGAVDKEPVGTFTQLPLRLGWAITIHKSQSLTLDEVALDVGVKGCFSHGQFYVAVSRVRDLKKLSFVNKPTPDDVIIRDEVSRWMNLKS